MMQTSPTPNERGFTLIELLVVLAIMSILAVVAIPRLSGKPASIERGEAAAAVAAALDLAQDQAKQSSLPVRALINSPDRLDYVARDGSHSGGPLVYPDGSNDGGTILWRGRPLLTVNWLTGETSAA